MQPTEKYEAHQLQIAQIISEIFRCPVDLTQIQWGVDEVTFSIENFSPIVPGVLPLICISDLDRLKGRPDFKRILRSKIHEQLGLVVLSFLFDHTNMSQHGLINKPCAACAKQHAGPCRADGVDHV